MPNFISCQLKGFFFENEALNTDKKHVYTYNPETSAGIGPLWYLMEATSRMMGMVREGHLKMI
jgi:hypothetical protein